MTTKDALADAIAGVTGSLVAMFAFYPIDVLKTNLQADKESPSTSTTTSSSAASTSKNSHRNGSSLQKYKSTITYILTLFRGLHYKTAHTVASSFAYFFLYSWLQSHHRLYLQRRILRKRGGTLEGGSGGNGSGTEIPYQPSTSARLIVSAVAAMMNVVLTLPLDVLAARSQTQKTSQNESDDGKSESNKVVEGKEEQRLQKGQISIHKKHSNSTTSASSSMSATQVMDQIWEGKEDETENGYDTAKEEECGTEQNCHDDSEEKQHDGEEKYSALPLTSSTSDSNKPILRISSISSLPTYQLPRKGAVPQTLNQGHPTPHLKNAQHNSKENDNEGFWKALWPSLLLCSNPSIHFTVFEIIKDSLFQYKTQRALNKNNSGTVGGGIATSSSEEIQKKMRLNMGEAFLIGIISKFAATIATYPLIRAKVMLMVSPSTKTKKTMTKGKEGNNPNDVEIKEEENEVDDTEMNENSNMVGLLRKIFADEGVAGLYKGCSLQLVHTLLKSALLMMVREKIIIVTRRLLVGEK